MPQALRGKLSWSHEGSKPVLSISINDGGIPAYRVIEDLSEFCTVLMSHGISCDGGWDYGQVHKVYGVKPEHATQMLQIMRRVYNETTTAGYSVDWSIA